MKALMNATIRPPARMALAVARFMGLRTLWCGLVRTATSWRCRGMYTTAIANKTISGGMMKRSG